jgi:hypothetical protein
MTGQYRVSKTAIPGALLGAAIVVLLTAVIASGLTIPALPAATDENFFQTNTPEDDFDALRQRARGALQTLIEKQLANERQRRVAATERMP